MQVNLLPTGSRPIRAFSPARASQGPPLEEPDPYQDRFERSVGGLANMPRLQTLARATWGRPPAYFAFSSEPLPPRAVQRLANRHHGNVLIGVDAGTDIGVRPGSDYEATVRAARAAGARLHVYIEGPGGPTLDRWNPGELERIRRAAARQGIDTRRPDWLARWNAGPWKNHAFEQLREFKRQGFESAEIDNLYRALGNRPERLVAFYREYAEQFRAGHLPRVVLKNINEPQMRALVAAIRSGDLPREMFADFHIYETQAGPRGRSAELAAELGIRTLLSHRTHAYQASGPY